MARIFSLRGAD